MDFRVLGPLEIVEGDRPLPLGGRRQRALLAALLVHANEVVATEQLIHDLWGERSPPAAANTVQVYVSRLRKLIGFERLERHASGYRLQLETDELDRTRFERLLEEARASEPAEAREKLDEALALWRGPPLADLAYEEFAQAEIRRLEELQVAALELRFDAELALGADSALVPELERLVAQHPLRERLRAQLMLALYRAGRQSEALAAYQQLRLALVEELGIEPGRELRELQRAILRQDAALAPEARALASSPRRAEPAADAERRKIVTCVFCDLSSSDASAQTRDPEALRSLLARALEQVREAAERYGGVLSGFVGDLVLVVFGLPAVREDDALRAVRAAIEMRSALADASVDARIAVTTGEVITGGESPVTGEAVTSAARIAQAAEPRDVLIGDATLQLVRESVVVALGPRIGGTTCWRVSSVAGAPPERRHDSPFVGREEELRWFADEFARAVETRACRLCTIVGAPGIGKSRLAQELVHSLSGSARVLIGRCLSHGERITYWPLAEIVREVGALDDVLTGGADSALIAKRIAGALGKAGTAGSAEETFWAFRRLFETLATDQPLIIVFDDLHWAEESLLDLLEYVAAFAASAPLLLLCLARSDLFEIRPSWTTPRPNSALLALQPLPPPDSDRLVRELARRYAVPESEWERIATAAEGNPLFVEQLVAMHAEEAPGVRAGTMPPTMQALLAARIERLPGDERAVIERAAIQGPKFHRGAIGELLPPESRLAAASSLVALARKELIRPDESEFAGDDAYRFRHALIADAAYAAIPKRARADLHERFVNWLEPRAAGRVDEFEAILGHHLEQTYRYRSKLDRDDGAASVAARAAAYLGSAGERAFARDDMPTAANLLGRTLELPWDAGRQRVELGLRLASALLDLGRTADAEAAADAAAAAAAAAGDRAGEVRAELFRGQVTIWTAPDFATLLPLAERALPLFDEEGDDRGSMEAFRVIALAALDSERYAAAAAAFNRALAHARRLGSHVDERELLGWLEYALSHGPTPVEEILRWAEDESLPLEELEPAVGTSRAVLLVMDGRVAEARELCARAERRLHELDLTLWMAPNSEFAWHVEMLAGDYAAAEAHAHRGFSLYEQMESSTGLGLCAGMLAQALCAQRRDEEAAHWSEVSEHNMGTNGISVDSGGRRWRQVRAKVLARRSELEDAERLAREAVASAEQTDSLRAQADALLDLAEVLELADRAADAAAATAGANGLYQRKGVRASTIRAVPLRATAR